MLEAGCYPFTIIPRVLTTDYIKETYHQEAGTPWDSERMLHLLNHDADRREAKRLLSIEPGIEQIYPLSPMQGLVMVQNIRSLNTGHDVSLVEYSVSGNIDSENFKKAWQTVVMRHAILRTGFKWRKLKEPFQVVYKTAAVPLIIENFQDYSLAEKEIRYQEYLAKEKKQGFKNAPLFKLILVKYDETSWRHIFKYQNSLFDGWSSNILMHEFNSIYEGLQKNTPVTLPALRPYSNYIHWLQHQDPEKAKMFWCSQFNGFDSENTNRAGKLPALAVDHTFAGATLSMSFTENEIESIEHFSKKNKINTYTLCQGAWILTLAKYSHSTVFVFGVAVSG
ncbi:MAG: condensation domain-containing protein, partial [Acidobacteria bacterium]|nr:condensation domain-containing protein [Acidobacteriota bacterium]